MKTKPMIGVAFGLVAFFTYSTCSQLEVSAWPNGISGYTGSINTGGEYCSSCHIISSLAKSNNFRIVSDIPTSGYSPGAIYNFSILIKSKQPRAGFDVRLENTDGLVSGEVQNVDSRSRIEQGELIHTYDTRLNADTGKFNFTWKAPSEGGVVNLNAAIATLLGDGTMNMDTLNLFNFQINQDITTSISKYYHDETKIDFYAFEENGNIVVRYDVRTQSEVSIQLIDSKGIFSKTLFTGNLSLGTKTESFKSDDLAKGIYLIKLIANEKMLVTKIAIN